MDSFRSTFLVCCALTYGYILQSLPLSVFKDRTNYLNYAENSWQIFMHYWAAGPLVALFNEPVWLLVNAVLAQFFPPDIVLRLIIFIPASLVAWQVLRQDSRYFICLMGFLFLPQVIDYHITALRQGMAIAVFLTGWFMYKGSLRWLILGLTPFIHASFFFVLALLVLAYIAKRLPLTDGLRTLLFVVAGLCVGIMLGWIVSLLGARQAEVYNFMMTNISGLGFVFWISIFGIMYMQGQEFMRQHIFETGAIVFYLSTYFLIEVTARIFESTLLLVLLAALHLTDWRRKAFFILITSYGISLYIMKLGQPWLGFGV